MKKIFNIFLLVVSLLFTSCETSTDVNGGVPYKEYTVINAQLSAYKVFNGVFITHTLPLNVPYDIKKAEIKNAIAYVLEAGTRVIPLHYFADGLYKPIRTVALLPQTEYELFVSINNKTIYSKTLVPDVPDIAGVSNVLNNYLSARVTAKPGEAYGAAWIVSGGGGQPAEKADDFFSIETSDQYPGDVLVRTQNIPPPYNTSTYSDRFFIQVYAFDKAYKNYFLTKTNSSQINNTFTSGGGPVVWNVYGEDVIGLFIGMTEGTLAHP